MRVAAKFRSRCVGVRSYLIGCGLFCFVQAAVPDMLLVEAGRDHDHRHGRGNSRGGACGECGLLACTLPREYCAVDYAMLYERRGTSSATYMPTPCFALRKRAPDVREFLFLPVIRHECVLVQRSFTYVIVM